MKKLYLILGCIFLSLAAFSQERGFRIEFSTGGELGTWTVDKGKESMSPVTILDKSRLAFSLPISVTGLYTLGRVGVGVKVKNNVLFTDEIIGWGYSAPPGAMDHTGMKYDISRNGRVNFFQVMAGLEYALIQKATYRLLPGFAFGTFWENGIHVEKEEFGLKTAYELGFKNIFDLEPFQLIISPCYSKMRTRGAVVLDRRTIHKIHHFGINVGLGMKL